MKLTNPILITINNTLHIKADNLEAVEVDSSCEPELCLAVGFHAFNPTLKMQLLDTLIERGIPLPQEIADRIEVREITKWIEHETDPYPIVFRRAFLLPVKEDNGFTCSHPNCQCTAFCTHYKQPEIYPLTNTEVTFNTEKSYTIEEIEKAIDMSVLENYQIEILKREIINNLKNGI